MELPSSPLFFILGLMCPGVLLVGSVNGLFQGSRVFLNGVYLFLSLFCMCCVFLGAAFSVSS